MKSKTFKFKEDEEVVLYTLIDFVFNNIPKKKQTSCDYKFKKDMKITITIESD